MRLETTGPQWRPTVSLIHVHVAVASTMKSAAINLLQDRQSKRQTKTDCREAGEETETGERNRETAVIEGSNAASVTFHSIRLCLQRREK